MNVKEKFDYLKSKTGITQKDLAVILKRGEGLVNGLLNENYKSGNKEILLQTLNNYLDESITKLDLKSADVWLSGAQIAVKKRLELMRNSGLSFFELILGDSGMGKTHLLRLIAKSDEKAIYIKARRSLSASSFMSLVLRHLGVKPKGNTDDKLELILEEIKTQGIKLIIIDEADLFIRDNDFTFERKFELLREIFEFSNVEGLGVSVVCVGLPELQKRINRLGGYLQTRFTRSPDITLALDELKKIGELKGLNVETIEYLEEANNARVFEKAAMNKSLGIDEKLAANLVYVRR